MTFQIREADLTHPQTLGLLRVHLGRTHVNAPPADAVARDLSQRKRPDAPV